MKLPWMSAGYKNSLLGGIKLSGMPFRGREQQPGESLAGFKRTGRRRRGVGRADWYLAQGCGQGGLALICS